LGLKLFLRANLKAKGGVSCVWFGYGKPRLTLPRYNCKRVGGVFVSAQSSGQTQNLEQKKEGDFSP